MAIIRVAVAAIVSIVVLFGAAGATAVFTGSAEGVLSYKSGILANGSDASPFLSVVRQSQTGVRDRNIWGQGASYSTSTTSGPFGGSPTPSVGDGFSLNVVDTTGQASGGASDEAYVDLTTGLVGTYSFTNNSAFDALIELDFGVNLFASTSIDLPGLETADASAFVKLTGAGDAAPLNILTSISVASSMIQQDSDSFSFSNPISFLLAAGGTYVLTMTAQVYGSAFSPATAVPLPPAALLLPLGLAGLMRASRRRKAAATA